MAAGLPSIPIALRPSTISVKVPKDDEYGGAYEEPVEISNVRFVKSAELSKNDYVLGDNAKGLIFIDATSKGAFDIPTGSLIDLEGQTLEVDRCSEYETFNGIVHHWEVEVS